MVGPLSGTLYNVGTVLAGSAIGLLLRRHLPQRLLETALQGIALITLLLGFDMARSLLTLQGSRLDGLILGLLSLAGGGLLGEALQLDQRLQGVGDRLQKHLGGQGDFTKGFVTASLLFCVGPMAPLGSLNNGLTGDAQLLILKGTMDGIAAIALASGLGIGVPCAAAPILIYQGSLALLATLLGDLIPDPATNPAVAALTGTGGLAIVAIGLNLLEVTRIRVVAFLPALAIAPLLHHLTRP
jgi:uncharacterized membrane protein YqgA involved in biofilm formation